MFWEILIAILLGILGGTITGLIPGIHVNLVALIVVSISPFLLEYTNPFAIVVFLFALATTHTFLDSIPSIFLGAPDPDTIMAVLPGHRMLLEGRAKEAVYLTLYGSLGTAMLCIFFFPLFVFLVPIIYIGIRGVIGHILILLTVFFIMREESWKKRGLAVAFFIASGILGILAAKTRQNPLLPLLSGLFGVSTLLLSLKDKNALPKQQEPLFYHFPETILKCTSTAVLAGGVTSFLPGIGAAQATLLARFLTAYSPDTYLITIGGVNTANFILSLAAFITIGKARNGAVAAMQDIIISISPYQVIILSGIVLVVAGVAALIGILCTNIFSSLMEKIDYKKVCITVIIIIILITAILSDFAGLVILITATAIGMAAPLCNVPRHHLMGCLLLQTIIFLIS